MEDSEVAGQHEDCLGLCLQYGILLSQSWVLMTTWHDNWKVDKRSLSSLSRHCSGFFVCLFFLLKLSYSVAKKTLWAGQIKLWLRSKEGPLKEVWIALEEQETNWHERPVSLS